MYIPVGEQKDKRALASLPGLKGFSLQVVLKPEWGEKKPSTETVKAVEQMGWQLLTSAFIH